MGNQKDNILLDYEHLLNSNNLPSTDDGFVEKIAGMFGDKLKNAKEIFAIINERHLLQANCIRSYRARFEAMLNLGAALLWPHMVRRLTYEQRVHLVLVCLRIIRLYHRIFKEVLHEVYNQHRGETVTQRNNVRYYTEMSPYWICVKAVVFCLNYIPYHYIKMVKQLKKSNLDSRDWTGQNNSLNIKVANLPWLNLDDPLLDMHTHHTDPIGNATAERILGALRKWFRINKILNCK